MNRFPRRVPGGFSLIEVLVAFSILTLALAALLQVVSGGLRNLDLAEQYSRGTELAQSTLARVGGDVPLQAGVRQGDGGPGYGWRVEIEPYGASGGGDGGRDLYRVVVTAFWGDGSREVRLVTLRATLAGNG